MRKKLNFLNPSLNSRGVVGVFYLGLLGACFTGGCAGRNIHSDLYPDSKILIRKGVLPTHDSGLGELRSTEYSNPVLVENTLIFGTRDLGLVSIYPHFNQQRWVLPLRGGVVSELTVDHGSVYFGAGDGFLYSVNIETGRVNWRYEIRNPVISKPALAEGRVFVTTSDDVVYGFDAASGKWLWHYRRRTAPMSTIYGASTPLIDGNDVIVGLSDGFLVSLNASDGQLKWERKLHQGSKFTDVDAKPVLENGIIYVPSYDGSLYALKRAGGEVLWRFDAGGSKEVVLDSNRIYFPSSEGAIYALQKNNAKVLWKFELDHGTPTQLVLTDRYVIVGSSFQYLYVIDRETGRGLYRYNVGWNSGFAGSPAYDPVNRRVYFLSHGGNLLTFRLRQPPRRIRSHGMIDGFEF